MWGLRKAGSLWGSELSWVQVLPGLVWALWWALCLSGRWPCLQASLCQRCWSGSGLKGVLRRIRLRSST